MALSTLEKSPNQLTSIADAEMAKRMIAGSLSQLGLLTILILGSHLLSSESIAMFSCIA